MLKPRHLTLLLIIILLLSACVPESDAPSEDISSTSEGITEVEETDNTAPEPEEDSDSSDASTGQFTDTSTFQQALIDALTATTRDYDYMQQTFFAEEFLIADAFSAEIVTPSGATERFLEYYLPAQNHILYDSTVDPVAKFGNTLATADSYLYTTGWGEDGTGGALILITRDVDGSLKWSGIQMFSEHDANDGQTGDVDQFEDMYTFQQAFLSAITAAPRDYAYLSDVFMADKFFVSDAFSAIDFTPDEAVTALHDYYLPPVNYVSYDLDVDPIAKFGDTPATADYYLYTTGWGEDGTWSALILITRGADGFLKWSGIQIFFENELESAADPVWEFNQALRSALGSPRDYEALEGMMSNPFDIFHWESENESLMPQAAADALYANYLPTGANPIFELAPDYTILIGGSPWAFYPDYIDFFFSSGWGLDGNDEVIIFLSMDDTGEMYWGGMIYAHGGFSGSSTGTYVPVPSTMCDDIKTEIHTGLSDEGSVTINYSMPFSTMTTGDSTGCQIIYTGTGENFPGGHMTVADNIRQTLRAMGWVENIDFQADGPTGTASGFERDSGLILMSVEWKPDESANCPDGKPISECSLTEAQKLYTITIYAAYK